MDKRVIFAVAGSGKTTYIVNELSLEKRSLILTYTDGNYDNISRKILAKFGGRWPNSVTLMTYFSFLPYGMTVRFAFLDLNYPLVKLPGKIAKLIIQIKIESYPLSLIFQ